MKVTRFLVCAVSAVLLPVMLANVQAVSEKRHFNQTDANACAAIGVDTMTVGPREAGQREPKCCGQCTTKNDKRGCLVRVDGKIYCRAC